MITVSKCARQLKTATKVIEDLISKGKLSKVGTRKGKRGRQSLTTVDKREVARALRAMAPVDRWLPAYKAATLMISEAEDDGLEHTGYRRAVNRLYQPLYKALKRGTLKSRVGATLSIRNGQPVHEVLLSEARALSKPSLDALWEESRVKKPEPKPRGTSTEAPTLKVEVSPPTKAKPLPLTKVLTSGGMVYVYNSPFGRFDMLESDVYRMKSLYSSTAGGSNMVVTDVASAMDLSVDEVRFALKVENFTKTSLPVNDETLVNLQEEEWTEKRLRAARQRLAKKLASKEAAAVRKAAELWHKVESEIPGHVSAFLEGIGGSGVPTIDVEKPSNREKGKGKGKLALFFGWTDFHCGSPGWSEASLITARNRITDIVSGMSLDRIIVPIGSDNFHVDTYNKTTTRGTHQDFDGFVEARMADYARITMDVINWAASLARVVELVYMPGNHDRMVTAEMFSVLQATLGHNEHLVFTVSKDYAPYTVTSFGKVGMMFHHGDGQSKTADLASTFFANHPKLCGRVKHRIVCRGNLHHRNAEESHGILNVLFPALASPDSYHKLKWPITNAGLDAMLVHSKRGRIAMFSV